MKISWASGAAAALVIAASAAAQHSVWLPEQNGIVVTPSYVFETFDHFWMGKDKASLGGDYRQHTALVAVDYGLTEGTALDAMVGWLFSETQGIFGNGSDEGLTDTTVGIRQRFLDETDFNQWWLPSLAVRAGGIIKGTYDRNFPFTAGAGASGGEMSLLAGKSIFERFGLFGDVGYRYLDGHVPDDWFGSTGVFASWKFMSLTAAYRFTEGLSGPDIGDPGFTFRTVREAYHNVEAALGFSDRGGRNYQVFVAHTFAGRNTGERDIIGGAISFTF